MPVQDAPYLNTVVPWTPEPVVSSQIVIKSPATGFDTVKLNAPVVTTEFVVRAVAPFTESFIAVTVPYTVVSSFVYTKPEIVLLIGKSQQAPLLPPSVLVVRVMSVLAGLTEQALQLTVTPVTDSVPWWFMVQEPLSPVSLVSVMLVRVKTPPDVVVIVVPVSTWIIFVEVVAVKL